jgi:hypothetical protein
MSKQPVNMVFLTIIVSGRYCRIILLTFRKLFGKAGGHSSDYDAQYWARIFWPINVKINPLEIKKIT